ncbi:MAG TPA: outer membrane lipid asymmetry maintenance protein MlaD [Polyangia bacterium]|jgi:phospholipid/cholesterol/gamma-HCH transport system substrate-binding protein
MLDYRRSEIIAGAFVLLGLVLLGYLSISIGGVHLSPRHRYQIRARFANVGDLKARAPVKIAGVTVGEVRSIGLADYFAELGLAIDRGVTLPRDTIASITTAGLLGEAYVALSPGAADNDLRDGDVITHTEPALNVADLLARYAFGGGASPGAAPDGGAPPAAPASSPQHRKERENR